MVKTPTRSFDYLNFAYGLGAAIVIVGAMFKFLGWAYANEMFLIGLTTEAIVFLISGIEFRTKVERPRWERIFPQIDPNYRGEINKVDLVDIQKLYIDNSLIFKGAIEDLNQNIVKLNDATEKLTQRVDQLGTNLDKLDSTTQAYDNEMTELKERVERLNVFYQKNLIIKAEA